MSSTMNANRCPQAELVCAYALHALPRADVAAIEAHLAACADCRRELETVQPAVEALVGWPTDVLRPGAALERRLALRIAAEMRREPLTPLPRQWHEPPWEEVAPGISCKLLANDTERHIVSMLVRLAPGASYPAHFHAGVEELHLLDGELWIDERKLYPGDYNRAEPGTGDQVVWSGTGCTCVLITSTKDVLR